MKKTLTVITLLAGAVAGYSQGELYFNINTTGDKEPVFNAQPLLDTPLTATAVTYGGYTVYETLGNSSYQHEAPSGTTAYTGAALSGSGYSAEILIGASGSTLAQLTPFGSTGTGGSVANFNTGAASIGYVNAAQIITMPTTAVGATVEIAIAAWNNEGGTVTTLAAAQKGDVNNSDPWGISNEVSYTLTGPPGTPPAPSGITAFDLGSQVAPEPSTIALGVMGISTLLFRRRK